MSDPTIPTWIFDYMVDMLAAKTDEVRKAYSDHLELVKHDHVLSRATQVQMLSMIADIIRHPRGGPDAALKAIAEIIEMLHKADLEEES